METEQDITKTLPKLAAVGGDKHHSFKSGAEWNGNRKGNVPTPDNLKDMLALLLTPSVRRKVAMGMIDLALHAESDKVRLDATREIWDRVEGRPRQAPSEDAKKEDVLLGLLGQVMQDHRARIAQGEVVRVLEPGGLQ